MDVSANGFRHRVNRFFTHPETFRLFGSAKGFNGGDLFSFFNVDVLRFMLTIVETSLYFQVSNKLDILTRVDGSTRAWCRWIGQKIGHLLRLGSSKSVRRFAGCTRLTAKSVRLFYTQNRHIYTQNTYTHVKNHIQTLVDTRKIDTCIRQRRRPSRQIDRSATSLSKSGYRLLVSG